MRSGAFEQGFEQGVTGCYLAEIQKIVNQNSINAPGLPKPPALPPAPGASDISSLDSDRDCQLSDQEFFGAVDQWISQSIRDEVFFGAVDAWIGQANICASAAAKEEAQVEILQRDDALIFALKADSFHLFEIGVFDMSGEKLFQQRTSLGRIAWRMRDERGLSLANGVYFYRAVFQDESGRLQIGQIKKFFILR